MDSNNPQPAPTNQLTALANLIHQPSLPTDLEERLTNQLARLELMVKTSGYRAEFDRDIEYIKFVSSLPFQKSGQDTLDLKRTQEILNKNHYGLTVVKDRILEYLAVLILNAREQRPMRSPVLAFVGLVGTGKTSIAYSIAEAMGRPIIRIPFGGLGSVTQLRGQSRVRAEAEPGQLMKAIKNIGVNNPVILLDEIDRIAQEARADVMGVLVELLDPEQNYAFLDHYVDYPFDLSKALFIATANNSTNLATAVLDRMEIIEMPSYTDEEKIKIAKDYILPKALEEAGLPPKMITIEDPLWPQIVRPLGFDGGIRSLQRNIKSVVRKIARLVIEGKVGPFNLSLENYKQLIT